jgi:transcriptional regulator with XRE-family HTH domain
MQRQGITKAALAERMRISRAQVDHILKAKGNVTIESLQRAAALVGLELWLELIRPALEPGHCRGDGDEQVRR